MRLFATWPGRLHVLHIRSLKQHGGGEKWSAGQRRSRVLQKHCTKTVCHRSACRRVVQQCVVMGEFLGYARVVHRGADRGVAGGRAEGRGVFPDLVGHRQRNSDRPPAAGGGVRSPAGGGHVGGVAVGPAGSVAAASSWCVSPSQRPPVLEPCQARTPHELAQTPLCRAYLGAPCETHACHKSLTTFQETGLCEGFQGVLGLVEGTAWVSSSMGR